MTDAIQAISATHRIGAHLLEKLNFDGDSITIADIGKIATSGGRVDLSVRARLLCASQAHDIARTIKSGEPLKSGKGTEATYRSIRRVISHLEEDRLLHDDIQKSLSIVKEGSVVDGVERAIGPLL